MNRGNAVEATCTVTATVCDIARGKLHRPKALWPRQHALTRTRSFWYFPILPEANRFSSGKIALGRDQELD